jgi:spectinomycin phosphotransferase
MRDDPGLDRARIAAAVEEQYGIPVRAVTWLPVGYDLNAAAYRIDAADGTAWFLKIRFGPAQETALAVQQALIAAGIPNLLPPRPARSGALWIPIPGDPAYSATLAPFVAGDSAMVTGLTDEQWRTFGRALRALHDSGLGRQLRGLLSVDDFTLPSAALVRQLLGLTATTTFERPILADFAAFWQERAGQIIGMLTRAERLGRALQGRPWEMVLCHADIHAANILVGHEGEIYLIDWDGPKIAPRERDLLFVIGSRIARTVTPHEEDRFFEGYGPAGIDPDALIYYRYERLIEDIGEIGKSVFLTPSISNDAATGEIALAHSFFAPGGDLEHAEQVERLEYGTRQRPY